MKTGKTKVFNSLNLVSILCSSCSVSLLGAGGPGSGSGASPIECPPRSELVGPVDTGAYGRVKLLAY